MNFINSHKIITHLAGIINVKRARPRYGTLVSFGARLLNALRLSLGRRVFGFGKPRSASDWDSTFARGAWSYLDSEAESLRFVLLAALLDRFRPQYGRVLDVGCGTGTLLRYLSPSSSAGYVGFDVSAEAISIAQKWAPCGTPFVVGSADDSLPPPLLQLRPFGVIVFSEVLYYLKNPFGTLQYYRDHLLAADGVFAISLWSPRRHAVLRYRLARSIRIIASVTVCRERGAGWLVLLGR